MGGAALSGGGDPLTGYFNTAAFARPAKGSYGNAPRNAVRKPSVNNTNFAVFKNVSFGGSKAAQLRAEIYNLFNQVEFQDIDRTARFSRQAEGATGALIARHVTDLFPTQTSRFDLAQAARRGVIAR